MTTARSVRVRGVVQGVGFRPFVYRLARANTLAGWVTNAGDGVEIHLEGAEERVSAFLRALGAGAPEAAAIATIDVADAPVVGASGFSIRESVAAAHPTARISPDLATCARCLTELFDPGDPRCGYPYINCTDCGPRYSIIHGLPYDRATTTMASWPMCSRCTADYDDPGDRRFHAQPVACPRCGPMYRLEIPGSVVRRGGAIARAAAILRDGQIVAVKGLGGYHLACDARNAAAVHALRERKYRKEKPFALMVANTARARDLIHLTPGAESLLESVARPIVLARAKVALPAVAPDTGELGVMLPYTPVHALLFAAGAPDVLVMTSANRSSEPIAYEDADARVKLEGIADAFLVGERAIARRVEDSVVRWDRTAPTILRRGRGYAPGAVAAIPTARPVLAVGADLKSTITLVVDGQAFVSQHIGDLGDYASHRAFAETIDDLLAMYEIRRADLLVAHDRHPQYHSTVRAASLGAADLCAVQHHRAHVASVLVERGVWERRVLGVSFDGTGYGDDGSIWGGELFVGSVAEGFDRVAHLRPALLAGGDAAASYPVQAAAGFLRQVRRLPDLRATPFDFPARYDDALRLLERGVRTFTTTSTGRLFDAAAALTGFTRAVTFEGQAAIWLEQLARRSDGVEPYPFPFAGRELDFRPLLEAVASDRVRGRDVAEIARAFHGGVAHGLCDALVTLGRALGIDVAVASGGVFQNALLVDELSQLLDAHGIELWMNHLVPANDGGVSLGQAVIAAMTREPCTSSRSR